MYVVTNNYNNNNLLPWPVTSSVITATAMLMCTPVARELYNITVTCTIHHDSTADQCVVMVMADDKVTRIGKIRYMHM